MQPSTLPCPARFPILEVDYYNKQLFNAYRILNSAISAYVAADGSLNYNASMASQWQTIGSLSFSMQEMTCALTEQSSRRSILMGVVGSTSISPARRKGSAYIVDWANKLNSGAWQVNDAVKIQHDSASDIIHDRIWLNMN